MEEVAARLQNEKPYQIKLEVTHGKEGYQASLVWRNDRTVKVNDTYLASEFKQTIVEAQDNLNQKIKNVS